MLEHPVFVYWCESCGREAPEEEYLTCPHCSGCVERYQRVLELPDASEEGAAFAFHSLKTALMEVSGGDSIAAAAAMLSEDGVDSLVAESHPTFACQLAALGVPPRVQQALVVHGFDSFDSVCEAVESMSEASAWVEQLGLPPAAEVLLRRLWHAAADSRKPQIGKDSKRRNATEFDAPADITTEMQESPEQDTPVKRSFRLPRQGAAEAMARELALQSWQLRGDEQMQAMEEQCSGRDGGTGGSGASDSEELESASADVVR